MVNVMRTTAVLLSLAVAHVASARAAPPTRDVLAFPAGGAHAPERPARDRRPHRLPDLVSVQIPMQTGSRNEVEPGKSGFAHFFEHMMFRGTKAYPPDAYKRSSRGSVRARTRSRPTTSRTTTLTFAKEDLEKVLEIEADRFQNLDYAVAAFKTEARAVLGEYNKNASNPCGSSTRCSATTPSRAHTYKHTTMGFLADIEDMPNQYEYSKTFFDALVPARRTPRSSWRATSMRGQMIALVERYFGEWKRGSLHGRDPARAAAAGARVRARSLEDADAAVGDGRVPRPGVLGREKDWPAVDLLFDLHFGETSRPLRAARRRGAEGRRSSFADSGAERGSRRSSRSSRGSSNPPTRCTSATRSCEPSRAPRRRAARRGAARRRARRTQRYAFAARPRLDRRDRRDRRAATPCTSAPTRR